MIGDASGSAQTRGLQQSGAGKGEAGKQPKLSSKALARLTFQVFPPRFVCYLSRFLLTFDSNSRAYWEANSKTPSQALTTFAEFADSVLVGLTDYFVGSYSSERTSSSLDDKKLKNGVLNLLALLKARYTRSVEKRQLSILFAFIPSKFQPIAEITSLLGEVRGSERARAKRARAKRSEAKRARAKRGLGSSEARSGLERSEVWGPSEARSGARAKRGLGPSSDGLVSRSATLGLVSRSAWSLARFGSRSAWSLAWPGLSLGLVSRSAWSLARPGLSLGLVSRSAWSLARGRARAQRASCSLPRSSPRSPPN
jgi:hypothetical protein